MAERRVIAHVDADAFYASVHLLEDPSLRGKPVIVAGSGARSIVTTASYEARRYGIHSAQPAARARQLCPHGTFIRPDFDLYRAYSRRAMALVRELTDQVQPLSLDEAYLDITALERPVRAMRELVARIEAETGLVYSVGIGPNKLCAKVLSDHRKPRAFNVASREQCCAVFAQSPPRLIPGIGPKTAESLEAMGIDTLAALRAAEPELLAERFGAGRGPELQARARFEHEGRVQVRGRAKSLSEERTFEHDIEELPAMEQQLEQLAGELAERLAAKDLRGRTIGIKVRLADFTTVTRARSGDEYLADAPTIARVAIELLREYDPPDPVRLLGVRVASFEWEDEAHAAERAAAALGAQPRLPGVSWDELPAGRPAAGAQPR